MKKIMKYQIAKLYKCIFHLLYKFLIVLQNNERDKALLILSRENKLQGNLKFIYNELKKKLPSEKIHFVSTENKMNLKLLQEVFLLSKAKYVILDDYYLPVYLLKPDVHLKVIQVWHAAGAFKKFGYSTIGSKFGPDPDYLSVVPIHANYSHVYVSSEKVVPFYAEAFHMPEKNIFPFGTPRIELYNDNELKRKTIDKIYISYPELENQKFINILIAPTYRAKGRQQESDFNIAEIIADIRKDLKSSVRILFKPHPYIDESKLNSIADFENIIIIREFSINEWMLIADAFITDYSSSIFDYSLLKRPLSHFVPDIHIYEMNRGFYEDIMDLSDGTIIKGNQALIKWINAREKNEYYDTSRMIDYNFDYTKGISKRIVDHFI